MNANHPIQNLLFFISGEPSSQIEVEMQKLIADISGQHSWIINPPKYVNETLPPEDAGEIPIRTVGGILELYSAMPPHKLPPDIDRAHFREVSFLVEALSAFSAKTGCNLEFELDGVFVGFIENGHPDQTLKGGFLGEWERVLQ